MRGSHVLGNRSLEALVMAFSEEEEVSPQENYGGGRQTISIFGCGARFG